MGVIASFAFNDPSRFIGEEIPLAGDLKSLDECRRMWTEAGRRPRGFPMPTSLFKRVAGDDLPTMWSWLRTGDVPLDTAPTRAVHPGARTLDGWLKSQIAAEHSAAT